MLIEETHQKTILIAAILLFFIDFSSAARSKRQIVFKDERENTVYKANCRMPNRNFGACVRLTSCDELRKVSRQRLRQYFCGFEGAEPKVCCPKAYFEGEEPTRRPTVVRTTVRPVRTTRRPTPRTTVRSAVSPVLRIIPEPATTRRPPPNTITQPPFLPKSCGAIHHTHTRVIGGSEAIKGSWPWMAIVFVRRNNGVLVPDCGGALVTNQHVVTAAHCVVAGPRSTTLDPSRIIIRLGAHDLRIQNEPGSIDVEVDEVRRHEQFEPKTYKNDIAVLKLRRPVKFNKTISPVCLPYEKLTGAEALTRSAFVIGYGTTAFNGKSSDVLMQASFDVRSQEECKAAYEPEVQISDVYLCAGMLDGSKDACQGDSGGPLVATPESDPTKNETGKFYLIGVVSFGKQCAQPNYPGVYANVTTFRDWLTVNLAN